MVQFRQLSPKLIKMGYIVRILKIIQIPIYLHLYITTIVVTFIIFV